MRSLRRACVLEPLHLDEIGVGARRERRDRGVEIAVFLTQAGQLVPNRHLLFVGHAAVASYPRRPHAAFRPVTSDNPSTRKAKNAAETAPEPQAGSARRAPARRTCPNP